MSITNEIENINKLLQERNDLKQQYLKFYNEKNRLTKELQEKRGEYSKAKQANDTQTMQLLVNEANKIKEQIESITTQLNFLKGKGQNILPILNDKLKITLNEINNENNVLVDTITKLEKQKQTLDISLQEKREEYSKAKQANDTQTMQSLVNEANKIKEQIDSIIKEINTHKETIQKNKELIDIFKKELNDITKTQKPQPKQTTKQPTQPQQTTPTDKNIIKKSVSYSGIYLKIEDIQEVKTTINKNELQTIKLLGIGDDGVKSEILINVIDNSKKKKYLNYTLDDWKKLMHQKALDDAKGAKLDSYIKEIDESQKQFNQMLEEKSNEIYDLLDSNEDLETKKVLEEKINQYLQLKKIQDLPKRKQEPAAIDEIAKEEVLKALNITLNKDETFEDYIENQKANAKERYLQDGHIIDIGSTIRIGSKEVENITNEYNKVIYRKFVSELNESYIDNAINRIANDNENTRILIEARKFITRSGVDMVNCQFDTKLNSFDKFEWLIEHSNRTFNKMPGIALKFYNFRLQNMDKIPLKERPAYQELNEIIQFFNLPSSDLKLEENKKLVENKYTQILNLFKNNPKIYRETNITIPMANFNLDLMALNKDIANKDKDFSEISMGIKNIRPILENFLLAEGVFEKQKDAKDSLNKIIVSTIAQERIKYVKQNNIPETFLAKYDTPKNQVENKTSVGFMSNNLTFMPYSKYQGNIINKGIKPKFTVPKEITYTTIDDLLSNSDIGEGIKEIIKVVDTHIQKNKTPDITGIGE